MDANEKIFNLQLIIQKQEEQLSLYRNGTTGPELLEIISEKEQDNALLKKDLAETRDSLRKIAKSSSEVIAKFDQLQREKDEVDRTLESARRELSDKDSELQETKARLMNTQDSLRETSLALEESGKCLDELKSQLEEKERMVDRLQDRCAQLVSEKSEKGRMLDDERSERAKQVKELREECERAVRVNSDLKALLTKDRAHQQELLEKLKSAHGSVAQLQESKLKKKEQIRLLEAKLRDKSRSHEEMIKAMQGEILSLQSQKKSLSTELSAELSTFTAERESLQSEISSKNCTIEELTGRVSELETVLKYHKNETDRVTQDTDRLWKTKMAALEDQLEEQKAFVQLQQQQLLKFQLQQESRGHIWEGSGVLQDRHTNVNIPSREKENIFFSSQCYDKGLEPISLADLAIENLSGQTNNHNRSNPSNELSPGLENVSPTNGVYPEPIGMPPMATSTAAVKHRGLTRR